MSDHDALLDRLRRAAASADPPPPELEGTARAAFGLSRLDEELAELLHDSELETVAVRGDTAEARLLSYGAQDVSADLEITPAGPAYEVTGTVHGPVVRVTVQTPDAPRDVDVDEHGRFRATGVDGTAVRVRLETESGVTVVTPWVPLR